MTHSGTGSLVIAFLLNEKIICGEISENDTSIRILRQVEDNRSLKTRPVDRSRQTRNGKVPLAELQRTFGVGSTTTTTRVISNSFVRVNYIIARTKENKATKVYNVYMSNTR